MNSEWNILVEDLDVTNSSSKKEEYVEETTMHSKQYPVAVYPNPANRELFVFFTPLEEHKNGSLLIITDITGKQVFSHQLQPVAGLSKVMLPDVANGLYFVQIISGNSLLFTHKLKILNLSK